MPSYSWSRRRSPRRPPRGGPCTSSRSPPSPTPRSMRTSSGFTSEATPCPRPTSPTSATRATSVAASSRALRGRRRHAGRASRPARRRGHAGPGRARRAEAPGLCLLGPRLPARGDGCGSSSRAPVFREALDHCAAFLDPRLDRPLLEVMFATASTDSLLDQTRYTQPALFALEYALAQLWLACGIVPDAVIGHSVGELTAAWDALPGGRAHPRFGAGPPHAGVAVRWHGRRHGLGGDGPRSARGPEGAPVHRRRQRTSDDRGVGAVR